MAGFSDNISSLEIDQSLFAGFPHHKNRFHENLSDLFARIGSTLFRRSVDYGPSPQSPRPPEVSNVIKFPVRADNIIAPSNSDAQRIAESLGININDGFSGELEIIATGAAILASAIAVAAVAYHVLHRDQQ